MSLGLAGLIGFVLGAIMVRLVDLIFGVRYCTDSDLTRTIIEGNQKPMWGGPYTPIDWGKHIPVGGGGTAVVPPYPYAPWKPEEDEERRKSDEWKATHLPDGSVRQGCKHPRLLTSLPPKCGDCGKVFA